MGVYVCCWRHLVLTRAASGTGAVAYVAAGYLPWFYTVSSFFTALVPLPWILVAAFEILRKRASAWSVLLLTGSLVLLLLSGQPQIMACAGVIVILLLALEWMLRGAQWRSLAWLLLCVGCGLIISAPQVLPFVQDQASGEAYSAPAHNMVAGAPRSRDGARLRSTFSRSSFHLSTARLIPGWKLPTFDRGSLRISR